VSRIVGIMTILGHRTRKTNGIAMSVNGCSAHILTLWSLTTLTRVVPHR